LVLVVSYLFAVPVSVLWVGLEKRKQVKLGCEKYVFKVTYGAPLDALLPRVKKEADA
jgi:hypothetical protein